MLGQLPCREPSASCCTEAMCLETTRCGEETKCRVYVYDSNQEAFLQELFVSVALIAAMTMLVLRFVRQETIYAQISKRSVSESVVDQCVDKDGE